MAIPQIRRYGLGVDGAWAMTESSEHLQKPCGFGLNPATDEVVVAYDLRNWICSSPEVGQLPRLMQSVPVPVSPFSIPEFRGVPGRPLAGGPAFDPSIGVGGTYLGFYLFDLEARDWIVLPINLQNPIIQSWKATKDGRYILYGAMHEYYAYDLSTGTTMRLNFDQ